MREADQPAEESRGRGARGAASADRASRLALEPELTITACFTLRY